MGRVPPSQQFVETLRNIVFSVLIEVTVAVECECDRRAAGTNADVLRVRACGYPKCDGGMSELVDL